MSKTDSKYKKGAYTLLFSRIQLMASGIVNGCACRDVDATLRIGDLNNQPLNEILSVKNKAYMQLIDEQQHGHFRPVCHTCDFYKSIYLYRSTYKKQGRQLLSLEEFMKSIG